MRNTKPSRHGLLPFLCVAVWVGCASGLSAVVNQKGPPVPWLIVGGGIHGVHMAARLLGEEVTKDVVIVDPCPELLYQWKTRTVATGMKYLRSSAGYHLDLSENSLRRSAAQQRSTSSPSSASNPLLSNDYERPQLDFFHDHCQDVIDRYELDRKHVKGEVTTLAWMDGRILATLTDPDGSESQIQTEHVILAVGNDELATPEWVTPEAQELGLVGHILDDTFDANIATTRKGNKATTGTNTEKTRIAIIGGGLTAAHKALELTHTAPKSSEVHMITRHGEWKEQQFDTHQDWMMDQAAARRSEANGGSGLPKRQQRFQEASSPKARRQVIKRERIPGTITAQVHRGNGGLKYAIEEGIIVWHHAEVTNLAIDSNDKKEDGSSIGGGCCSLTLSSGEVLQMDKVLLATGFGTKPPAASLRENGPFLKNLPTSDFCGYPIVNHNLEWGSSKQLYVMGALAELELGPSARNIAGARLAAERIVQAAKERR